MKFTKRRFFFLCFLLIGCSINAGINPVKSYVIKYQHGDHAVSTTEHNNEKKQLDQLECVIHSCFRLTESAISGFQNANSIHLLLIAPLKKPSVFSKHYYSCYAAKRLHRFSDFSLYLRYLRLLI